ncbi:hypothetical protein [Flindersiella endophytica]
MAKQKPTAGRHPLSVGSLVVGLIFCGIALAWLLNATNVLHADDLQWAIPILLVGVGAIGVGASIARGRNRGSGDSRG